MSIRVAQHPILCLNKGVPVTLKPTGETVVLGLLVVFFLFFGGPRATKTNTFKAVSYQYYVNLLGYQSLNHIS